MTRIPLLALVLCVGLPLPLWAQDVASLIAEDTLTWGSWEQEPPADKFARLRDLGVCYVEQSQSPANYRFVDFSGDGVTDVIYSGWNVDCDGAGAGEGRATRFYHVQRDSARLVFKGLGIITDMNRPSSLAPVAFVLRYGGCCGDPRMFVAWYSATIESGSLRFAVADKIMYFRNLGHPTRYFERPRRFRVTNDIYNLRWTPQVDDESEDYFFDPEHRGNALAQFQRGAGGVALGASPDSTGRVWWLVLMDPSSRPVSYVIDDNDDYNGGPPPRWLGWMSSRFLETVETPARDSGQQEGAVVADSAALALVDEYLRRDAQGEFTRASEWLDEYVIGFTGSDFVSLVSDYKILAAATRGDTTRVTVRYNVIGGFDTGYDGEPVWTLTDSVDLHTFVVLRMKEGMRLDDPLPAIHVSGRVVLERNLADAEYRRALEEVLRRKGGALPPDSTREAAAAAKSDARLLVEEYLRRDARGEFTRASEWLAEVTSFDSAAYDPMTVVNSHEVLAEETTGDTTCITVQYGVRAGVKSDPNGPIWSFTDSVELHTFVVVRTERGLQLAGPALNPHISGRFVLEHLLFEEQHRRALEALRREGITPPARDSRQEVVVVADSTPLALVEEYLRRDARGEFTRVSEWLAEVAPYAMNYGWDAATVIRDYEILATEARGNTTRITVRYDVVGGFVSAAPPDGLPMWSLTDSVELQTFVVVRTERGFRLSGPPLNPHMSARYVLEQNLADEEYRRALEETLRREGG